MYFLDTDTLTWAHAGRTGIVRRIQQVGEENVATTVITAIEILRGRQEYLLKAGDAQQLVHAQQLLDLSEELLRNLPIIRVESLAAAEFERLRQNKKLKKIGRADLLIACIVLAHRSILVTRNLKHFRQVPGLQVENWYD